MRRALGCVASTILAATAHAGGPTLNFNIPRGPASEALKQFRDQSHIDMVTRADDVRDVTTNEVQGALEVSDALEQMLKGTPLEYAFESDYSYVTVRAAEAPAPAPVQTPTAPKDPNSRPSVIPEVLVTGSRSLNVDIIRVTGTLIRGVLDVVSPLTSISRDQMKAAPYATVQDALRNLPASFGGELSEGFSATTNLNRSVGPNLRGLGTGATLVLVNGQRQPYSGAQGDFVDISNLPLVAIERIEVLTDGASSLYGSDAVGGVVNVIMRKDLAGAETQARYGVARGGAHEQMFSQAAGSEWENGNVFIAYQYSRRTPLPASARDYTANADKRPFGGSDFRGWSSSPGNILDPKTLLPAYGIPAASGDGKAISLADLEPNTINLQNPYAGADLLSDRRMHSVFGTASLDLTDRIEGFTEGRFSLRESSLNTFAAEQALFVPASNPFYLNPFSDSFVVVDYSFLNDLGTVRGESRTSTVGATTGLRIRLAETWRLALSQSYGRESMRYSASNYPDADALRAALADPNPATAFDPFGDGSQNAGATLDKIRGVRTIAAASTISATNLVADGAVVQLPSGLLKLAVGADVRQEWLDNSFHAANHFARSVSSAFAEVLVPVVGDPIDQHLPRLEMSLSARLERFSDFGSSLNPKIGLRFVPGNKIKLRGTWGTSFRAPKLSDLYDASQNLTVLLRLPDSSSMTGQSVVLARQGNNPDLRAETATTWTAGIDVVPVPGLVASLSYFEIEYKDRIVVPGPASSPFDILLREEDWGDIVRRYPHRDAVAALCESAEFRGPVSHCMGSDVAALVDYTVRNMAATQMKGIDLNVQQELLTDYGQFRLGLNGTYVLEFQQALSPASPLVERVDTVGNPLALRVRGTAEWYQYGDARWGFGLSAALNHWGAYRDSQRPLSRPVSALTTLDLRASYRTRAGGYFGDVEVGLGVVNLLDAPPPFVNRETGYDVFNAEPYGRVVSLSVQKNW